MRSPATILLDLDGTLLDSRPAILRSVRHALVELGHPCPSDAELGWFVGPPLEHGFARLLGAFGDDRVALAVATYRRHYEAHGLLDGPPFPGIVPLLSRLRATGRLPIVATSKRRDFAVRAADHFGLTPHLAAVHGAEHGRPETKATLIARILAAHRIAPGDATMVGDRDHDVLGARANGVPAIGVLYGYGSRDELAAAGCTAFAATPEELAGALDLDGVSARSGRTARP